jgi:hypothetical protein
MDGASSEDLRMKNETTTIDIDSKSLSAQPVLMCSWIGAIAR